MTIQISLAQLNYFSIPGVPVINPDASRILKIVSSYFNVVPELLKGKTRKRDIVEARQITMYFIRKKTRYSLAETAGMFGGRDHTTCIHSIQTVRDLMQTDPIYKLHINNIEQLLHS